MLALAVPLPAGTAAGIEAYRSKDYQRAFEEWKLSAGAGDAEAQFDLGVLYAQGLGVPRDLSEAARWYRKAALQGYAEARFAMGRMYSQGWGAPRDEADALRRFQSATVVDPEGRIEWPEIKGSGMRQDLRQAAYWYGLAAEQGHAQAQVQLALLYAAGRGVKRDAAAAYFWLTVASLRGEKSNEKLRATEAARLKPGELAAQDRAAQAWTAR